MTDEKIWETVNNNYLNRSCELSDRIFDHPETGRKEFFASGLLISVLESEGFSVEKGIGNIDTAFRATWENGKGGPSIGFLCEYDALLEYGHACAHHMQGPTIVAAVSALKAAAGTEPFKIVVYGTPDEEYGNGKIEMLKAGCFKDIDVALMVHAGPDTTVDIKSLAQKIYTVEFFGKSSHAALKPEDGRSAVDAMILAIHGMELLREHVRDDVRLHYAILKTPESSNTVPDYAKIEFNLRSYSSAYLDMVCKRFEKVLNGAAMMTETSVKYEIPFDCKAKIPVLSLNERITEYAEKIGAPQRIPYRERTGSTDFANVLYEVPGSCVRIAFVPQGTGSHSEMFIRFGKSEEMHKAIGYAACILVSVAKDIIEDASFFDRVRSEFSKRKNDETNVAD